MDRRLRLSQSSARHRIDGPTHDHSDETRRTEYLESQGFTILRFDNEEIRDDLTGVCALSELTLAELRAAEES